MCNMMGRFLFVYRDAIAIWNVIGQDQELSATVIDQLLEILSRSLPYEEQSEGGGSKGSGEGGKRTRQAMHTPLAVSFSPALPISTEAIEFLKEFLCCFSLALFLGFCLHTSLLKLHVRKSS